MTVSRNFCSAVMATTIRAQESCPWPLERRPCGIIEIAVQCGNDLRALTDRATDALDRARTDVTHCEDAGHRGLQCRCGRACTVRRPGNDEAGAIDLHATAFEPVRCRIG